MVWNDKRISDWAQTGGVTPFDAACVNPASLDLRLGNLIREPHPVWLDMTREEMRESIALGEIDDLPKWGEAKRFDKFWLFPGEFVLCHSLELVRIPIYVASILVLKSSKGRLGLNHSHSGWGDPGFGLALPQSKTPSNGDASFMVDSGASWTWELQNISPWPIKLTAGERLIQQVFFDMLDAPDVDYRYTGHYVYQAGPTEAYGV
jgi:deoxycytidine triphosphate deaminase